MTVKCTFCNDTKQEPGEPGRCVWCEEVEPVALGTVTRYAESCGEGGGVVEHASGQFVEFKDYDAALAREAALREDLDAWKSTAETFEDFYRKTEVESDTLQQRLTAAEQRAEMLEREFNKLRDVAHGCYQIASSYSGCIDGVEEHGGDDHEDPSCAIHHRLYYAMFDADRALKPAAEGEGS